MMIAVLGVMVMLAFVFIPILMERMGGRTWAVRVSDAGRAALRVTSRTAAISNVAFGLVKSRRRPEAESRSSVHWEVPPFGLGHSCDQARRRSAR
jgi:hypothetical protein